MAGPGHLAGLLSAYADDEDEEEMDDEPQHPTAQASLELDAPKQGQTPTDEGARQYQGVQGTPKDATEASPGTGRGGESSGDASTGQGGPRREGKVTPEAVALGMLGHYGADAGEDEDEHQDQGGANMQGRAAPEHSAPAWYALRCPGRVTPPAGAGASTPSCVKQVSPLPGTQSTPLRENRSAAASRPEDTQDRAGPAQENGASAAHEVAGNGCAVGGVGGDRGAGGEEGEDDLLLAFLGPPVTEACEEALQAKFRMFHARKQQGLSLNDSIRKSKDYRNPYLMQQIVESKGIEEHSTFFPKEIFDPKGYPASDFYDTLLLEQRREAERREAERKAKGAQAQVEFHRGGVLMQQGQAQGGLAASGKPLVQVISGPKPSAGAPGATAKKSKWDKGAPGAQTTPPSAAVLQQTAAQALLSNPALLAAQAGASGIGRGAHIAAAAARAAAAISAAAAANAGVAQPGASRKEDDRGAQRRR